MVSIITILLFFIYLFGLGFTALRLIKTEPENFLERTIVRLGVGLGVFSLLSIFLTLFRIPLDWRIFLALSLIYPFYHFFRSKSYQKIRSFRITTKFTKETLYLLAAIVIALISLSVYVNGAFAYPFLENEDPWGHSVGTKYVALEKDAYDPPLQNMPALDPVLSYIDPYPPAYNILLGILHQTSPNLNWTMKFFNSLLISLGFVFFYVFARRFIGERKKALVATFILAAIPSYLSHFIWAHALVITLLFPTLYIFDRMRKDTSWWPIAAVLVGAIWVAQNFSQPLKLSTLLLLYVVVISITSRKFLKHHLLSLVGGVLLSFGWWGVMIYRHGFQNFLSYYGAGSSAVTTAAATATTSHSNFVVRLLKALTDPGGTASRAYTFNDFFVAKSQNLINAPIGIGVVVSLLALLGVVWLWFGSFMRSGV